jgi:hypothetical protein
MREIASDFPHANCIVLSAVACWQVTADRTYLKRGQMNYQMETRIPSAQLS